MALIALIIKHLLSSEYGPFDRFLEIGICLFVGYEVIVTFLDRREKRRRKKLVNSRSEAIRTLISKGHQLLVSAPHSPVSALIPQAAAWIDLVHAWNREVQALLQSYSSQALASYNQGIPHDASFPGLALATHRDYAILLLRLDNLRNIMEKTDVYL